MEKVYPNFSVGNMCRNTLLYIIENYVIILFTNNIFLFLTLFIGVTYLLYVIH